MTKADIARRVAGEHNGLNEIFGAGGVTFHSADAVILMGDVIRDMRALAAQIQNDAAAEGAEKQGAGG